MAGILADEDFSLRVVEELRRLGHDVVTVRALGLANRGVDDSSILVAATQNVRAVVTYNRRHFGRLHLSDANHAGIIVCTRDPDVVRQARRIHDAISALDSLAGRLIRITRPSPAEDPARRRAAWVPVTSGSMAEVRQSSAGRRLKIAA
jgi:predicted nuclease of predicted toxin-antitoxin system